MRKQDLLLAIMTAALTACSGTMQGMVRGDGQRVTIAYTEGWHADSLRVTMPDGEVFQGKAVPTEHAQTFGTVTPLGRPPGVLPPLFLSTSSMSGNIAAVLFGDRGGSMRCTFHYASAGGHTSEGGIGVCETADGRVIDVQW